MDFEVTTAFRSCPECHHRNPKGTAECTRCGASLKRRFCLGCGAANDVSASICRTCGETLSGVEPHSVMAPLDSQWAPDTTAASDERAQVRQPAHRPKSRLIPALLAGVLIVGMGVTWLVRNTGQDAAKAPLLATPTQPVPSAVAAPDAAAVPVDKAAVLPQAAEPAPEPAPARATALPEPASGVSAVSIRAATSAASAQRAATAGVPVSRRGSEAAGAPADGRPSQPQKPDRPCTPSLAALALCTMNN